MALDNLKEYLLSEKTEEQKRPLIYKYFSELFKKEFHAEKRKADVYIDGQLLVETKTHAVDFLEGFYQALHYRKKGLTFSAVCVIAHKFIGLWKQEDIPKFASDLANRADPLKPASEIGVVNARKTGKSRKEEIRKSASFLLMPGDIGGLFSQNTIFEVSEFQKIITNLEAKRHQIDSRNFIETIVLMEKYFDKPLDAIHCFYAIVGVWDETCTVGQNENKQTIVFSQKKGRFSETLDIHAHQYLPLKKFIEYRYIFTNEGSGLTEDYYFSRFDEVITRLNPEYAKQHGIFFTDINLSKFALWFVHHYFEKKLSEKYVVLDPAGGSGNLVTSWKGHLKHKIVSELQPDLLKTIERRMQLDPEELQAGFTIIPKTSDGVGLNFLNISGEDYLNRLEGELQKKNLSIDKPLAFLLNPPYKNTDENKSQRDGVDAEYEIDPGILEITGTDAGRERYLAFLGQIVNICKSQVESNPGFQPLLLIFTPTSWLIPRPTYVKFRAEFDKHFKYENGFIVTGKEFFKLPGKWPLSFTIWSYAYSESGNNNRVKVRDFTQLKKANLDLNWNDTLESINSILLSQIKESKTIKFDNSRGDIRDSLPSLLKSSNKKLIRQTRYDYSHAKRKQDYGKLVSGFPLNDDKRHYKLKRTCGTPKGTFIGFMDDCTPVRLNQDNLVRMSTNPDRVWFRLDLDFKGVNKTKIFNGSADNRSYCAYDNESAKATMSWFAITKALNGVYPIWANQYDIWPPQIKNEFEEYYYALCFAFALAENVCVVTKFEANNPVKEAPEVFVDNPMCPVNPESFWSSTLDAAIAEEHALAKALVDKIKELYNYWNLNYCKGKTIEYVGLQDEPYFKYFDYPDFLTPWSGLIQIRKYATINTETELLLKFEEISKLSKAVKTEIYRLLVEEFKYFD